MVKRTHHIGFTVKDLERSVRFYQEGLGLELITRIPGPNPYHSEITGYPDTHLSIAFFKLPGSDAPLELIEYVSPTGEPLDMETNRPGNGHFGVVVDDLEATIKRLQEYGGKLQSKGIVSIPTGPNKGAKVVYLRDPDGITVELFQYPQE
jgi:catechol 2,3-dioxygenase-like lactoylglutathione lyase family enzyme